MFYGILPESQGRNLALNALDVRYVLDSGVLPRDAENGPALGPLGRTRLGFWREVYFCRHGRRRCVGSVGFAVERTGTNLKHSSESQGQNLAVTVLYVPYLLGYFAKL